MHVNIVILHTIILRQVHMKNWCFSNILKWFFFYKFSPSLYTYHKYNLIFIIVRWQVDIIYNFRNIRENHFCFTCALMCAKSSRQYVNIHKIIHKSNWRDPVNDPYLAKFKKKLNLFFVILWKLIFKQFVSSFS